MGKKYKHPPIIEAVCEFRFEPGSPWDLAVPGLVYEKIRSSGFTKRQPIKDVEFEVMQSAGRVEQELKTVDRMRFLRDDEKAFIQVGPDKLSVHHLKPYPSWPVFQPLVLNGLDAYLEAVKPKGIQRIGLRYINRIEIPGTTVRIEDYFEFYPFVGKKLPQEFGPFIVGIEVPYESDRDMLRIMLTSIRSTSPNITCVVLDLDYFLNKPESVLLTDVSNWISIAHDHHVEEVFEACITDPLRKIFEEEKP
jgi:uncharacterized protein (TIGR04255 family)